MRNVIAQRGSGDNLRRGIADGYFDGPRAWQIVTLRIEGEAGRTESDKQFYLAALEMQKGNPLLDGCSSADFQKKAFAFVQYILPNLAQKHEPADAAEYILKLLPKELYEAGQRVKFATKLDGHFLDLKYLIRACSTEVFQKQRRAPP